MTVFKRSPAPDEFDADPVLSEVRDKLQRRRARDAPPVESPPAAGRAASHMVDIHMPLRHGDFLASSVVDMLVRQDVPFALYIDPSEDVAFSRDTEGLLAVLAPSSDEVDRIKHTTRIAYKRNRLRERGTSPYIYFADADVLCEQPGFLVAMMRALDAFPDLGMVGLCYQPTRHVACGSMMLRRRDVERIGPIRGTGLTCACTYLGRQIKQLGLRVVPLERTRAREIDLDAERARADAVDERVGLAADGALSHEQLAAITRRRGTGFRLFVSAGPERAAAVTGGEIERRTFDIARGPSE